MIRITTPAGSRRLMESRATASRRAAAFCRSALVALTFALTFAMTFAGSGASAWTPVAIGVPYETCGQWKNRMRNYGTYRIDDYNQLVPPNLAVPTSEEVPVSTWRFLDNGTSLGHPVDDSFVGVLDIVDQMGTSLPQVIRGDWDQRKKRIRMNVDTAPPRSAFVDPAGVRIGLNEFVTTTPHGLYDGQGPYRFDEGSLPGNTTGVLPTGINKSTDYYVIYVNATTFAVSLTPTQNAPRVTFSTQGTGRHQFYPFGEPLPNSFEVLSELFLFGDREVVGVVDFVTVGSVKLRGRLTNKGTQLRLRLVGRSEYDVDTDDVLGFDFRGAFRYRSRTSACP